MKGVEEKAKSGMKKSNWYLFVSDRFLVLPKNSET